jgi:hypothetical protein
VTAVKLRQSTRPSRHSVNIRCSAPGTSLLLETAPPAPRPSAFVFSLNKAGSTLLHKIVAKIARQAGVPTLNLAHTAFKLGIDLGELDHALQA